MRLLPGNERTYIGKQALLKTKQCIKGTILDRMCIGNSSTLKGGGGLKVCRQSVVFVSQTCNRHNTSK
jgi:hypothetical protein